MPEFISQPIEVLFKEKPGPPVAFVWQGQTIEIVQILEQWQDWHHGATHPIARSWRTRRHRNYYRVKAGDGHVYEIYLDRSRLNRLQWYLYRRID